MQAPILTDGTVTLRPHRAQDVDQVLAQSRDPQSARWTSIPQPYTRRDAEDWVASRASAWRTGSGELSLVVDVGGVYAGQLGLRPDGPGAASIGYGLAPAARGRGVMSAAVRLGAAWAFSELALQVLHWQAYVGNWPSRRVAWACGFTLEGRVRGLARHRDGRADAWVASLCAGEPMRPASEWLDLPELHGPRVLLRRQLDRDVPRIVQAGADPLNQAWLPELPHPYTPAHAAEHVASREEQHAAALGLFWAVGDPVSGRLLGEIALMGLGGGLSRSGEIGYWTHPDARGRGLTVEAVRLATRHALVPVEDGGLGLARVVARVARGNDTSMQVLRRAGFTEVGVDRGAELLRDGTVADFVRFDLLADEL